MILPAILNNTGVNGTSRTDLDALIRRLATGDREALARLYKETQAAVYGFSLSIVKNSADAEDVLQETYIHVWNAADGYCGHGKAMSWLLIIAKNLSLMKLRDRARYQDLPSEAWMSMPAQPGASVEDRHLLQTLLLRLSEEERQIVMLHAVAGMKHREIAVLTDLALPTVLSKYHRALKKLRTYMEGADAHD